MNLDHLLDRFIEDPRTNTIQERLKEKNPQKFYLKGILRSEDTFVLSSVYNQINGYHLAILNDKEEAAYFQNDLKSLSGKKDIFFFPDSFKKPGVFEAINRNNVLLRTETLNRLVNSENKGEIIITYPEAIFEKVFPPKTLLENTLSIKNGESLGIDFMIEVLNDLNFERTDFVYEPGQFSIRGDIIDIYSFGNDFPYRVELFGDEVESIRTFDPVSQLSQKKITKVTIIPNIDNSKSGDVNNKVSLIDFLPKHTTIWIKNETLLQDAVKNHYEKLETVLPSIKTEEEEADYFSGNIDQHFVESSDLLKALHQKHNVHFGNQEIDGNAMVFNGFPQPHFNKDFNFLIQDLKKNSAKGYENYIFAENPKQFERFHNIFEDRQAEVSFRPINKAISEGFVDQDLKIACYTEHQIFNKFHKYQIKQGFTKNQSLLIKTLKELKPGDYVTHIDHGVGKYSGLEKIDVDGKMQEAIRLVYANNDLLYVSINSLHKVSKYVGKDGTAPRVNKIGSDAWEQVKRKAKKQVKDIARDLIQLYAKRKASKGFSFSPDTYIQNALEASFIYEDTPDQFKATQDVKKDMEASHPMDRLVCGDVGFGKTEVAIRAAFKAVNDSKQVAVLVPTTILALQHYKTFKDRIGDLPCNVDYLNRFKSSAQKKETLQKLEEGKVDILIGTHAIIGKNVKFKDLGLLIIDEEQKFGVAAKEKLRTLKHNVDTLTLTATPIPRTLQFSLMGSRDLSVINTPPPNRQPINTEMNVWNDEIMRDAIYYEVHRGGQVFFIHDRVKNIEEIGAMLQKLCPDLDMAIAHGQMDGAKLEKILQEFVEGKYDILLSTTIVESGIDISNVNTIIINNAHQFGLSDLHQLRGRVGRSNKKAFCYLFGPPLSTLTPEARKRLQTIVDYSDLGSGFNIAMRDLDIRGAGNILGGEQSGFISEIGFDMYQKILDEAMLELKETEFKSLFEEEIKHKQEFVKHCQLETDLEILIPDNYIRNINERLSIYTELNNLKTEEELETFKEQLIDRFGPLPNQVLELIDAIQLQWVGKKLGFEKIIIKKTVLRGVFIENQSSLFYESDVFGRILKYIQFNHHIGKLKQTNKYLMLTKDGINNIEKAKTQLDEIWSGIAKTEVVASH